MKHTGEITWSLEILKSATEREIIAAKEHTLCLKNCGLSYCIEPTYPDSGMRADFGIYNSFHLNDQDQTSIHKKPKQIFLEIAGINNDEKYNATLSKISKFYVKIFPRKYFFVENGYIILLLKFLC